MKENFIGIPGDSFRIEYDDQQYDSAYSAIHSANKLLKPYNLELEINDDGKEHDSFMIMIVTLKKLNNAM